MKIRLAIFIILALTTRTWAEVKTDCHVPMLSGKWNELREVKKNTEFYPVNLANLGIQGVTYLKGSVLPNKRAMEYSIAHSSGSPDLDALAISYAKKHIKGKYPNGEYIFPIDFSKDTPQTIKEKSCRDFTADWEYFSNTFPGCNPYKMNSFLIAEPIIQLTVAQLNNTQEKRMNIYNEIINSCKKNPDEKFYETILKESTQIIQGR